MTKRKSSKIKDKIGFFVGLVPTRAERDAQMLKRLNGNKKKNPRLKKVKGKAK